MSEVQLIDNIKPYVVKETKVPGDNNAMRVVRMSDGAVNVYYHDRLIGNLIEGNDNSLAAVLEATVDYALERKHAKVLEKLNSPAFMAELETLMHRWLVSNLHQRKTIFGRIFG